MNLCSHRKAFLDESFANCGTSYQTSEMVFEEDTKLVFKLRFVYFADSLTEKQVSYDSIITMVNKFYSQADISFKKYEVDTVVSPEAKNNMPSYVMYNNKIFKNDNCLTCYIYGDYQPNYSDDAKSTSGSAGGIGSNFFAIRKSYVYGITMMHELGHNFSLLHTFLESTSDTPYSIYDADLVCDTRSIHNLQDKVSEDCTFTGDDNITDEEKNQAVCNFMSWNFIRCKNCITEGQIRKMRFYIHESPKIQMTIAEGLNKNVQ